jgi:heptosyltransferase II
MLHILIVKNGALGDVVRTSYFAGALRKKYGKDLRLSWITAESARPLLDFNPHINDLWTNFNAAKYFTFDRIFSLDDEVEIVSQLMPLKSKKISGAYIDSQNRRLYSDDVSSWFDMGLLSRHGVIHADYLKKTNTRSHTDIFSEIFEVQDVTPEFYSSSNFENKKNILSEFITIGINPYAGGRWRSKELRDDQLELLVNNLLEYKTSSNKQIQVRLIGAGQDLFRNLALYKKIGNQRISVLNTESSLICLANRIRELDLLITSDSLALHLAIAQNKKFIAFFSPTSGNEIDSFGLGYKILSTAEDYCSYKADADNSTITADRIMNEIVNNKIL